MNVFVTIRGGRGHEGEQARLVAHAIDRLSGEFGPDYATRDEISASLADEGTVLVGNDDALALLLRAGSASQRLRLMWVEPNRRGNGLGGDLLDSLVGEWGAHHKIRLDCPASREAFYLRHGFVRLMTAEEGRYVYMGGPAQSREEVKHLLPPSLR